MIQTLRMTAAGARKPSVTACRRSAPGSPDGGAATGGSTAIPPLLPLKSCYFPALYAFAAAASRVRDMPVELLGLFRMSWKILNSPCPTVAPNDAGWRSERSNTNAFALPTAVAVVRVIASGYADAGTVFAGAV